MSKKIYQIKVFDEKLQRFLDSRENVSEFFRQLAIAYMEGKPATASISDSIDYKLKEARLENIGYKNRIEKVKADYAETFGKPVSPTATTAIEKRFESAKPTTAKEISINQALKWMQSCKQNDLNQWVIICEVCRADCINENRELALNEFREHMVKNHQRELLI